MATPDFSGMSDDDLLASVKPRAQTPASTPSAAPDFSSMSDDDLLASVKPKAAPAPAAPQRSLVDSAARGLGIGVRGAVQGLTDLPAMVTDNLIAKPINAGLNVVMGEGQGPRMKMLGEAAGDLLTKAGLPTAETASERVVQDINRGGASALTGIATGAGLANAAGGVTQAVGKTLSAAPLAQVASGASGAGAQGLTREGGGGEGAQFAANVAGSLAPSVVPFVAQSAVRGALRGGEAGRQRVAENIKIFEEASGTVPTMGQATQSRTLQAAETGLSNVIGGSGLMARRGELQAKALEDSVQALSRELAPDATGWGAGEAITKGVNAFKDSVKTTQKALYNKLDEYIPPDTYITSTKTQQALADLNADIAGAPALSKWFKNARIQGIEGGLKSDTDGVEAILTRPGMREKADALRAKLTEEAQKANAINQRHIGTLQLQTDEAVVANKAWRQGLFEQAEAAKLANQQWRDSLVQEAEKAAARNAERQRLGMRNLEPVASPKDIKALPDKFPVMSAKEINALPEPNSALSPKDIKSIRPPNAVRSTDEIEREVMDTLRGEVDGKLPYESIKKLRTLVGQEISENSLTSDVPRSKWRALYAALSDDLGTAAEAAGPQAQQAWSRANQYTRGSMQRLDQLESIVNRDAPEKIFKAATTGLSDGGTQINRLMKSMPEENRREVAAAVLQRLGRAKNSSQNEMGDAFSSETFLTNLAAMSLPARRALFSNSGFPGLEQKLMAMGKMASNRREGAQVFANPSGTARQAGLVGFYATLGTAIATGNLPLVAKLAAIPAGSAAAASFMTNPNRVRKLGERVVMSDALAPATLASAARAENDQQQPAFRNRLQAGEAARRTGGVVVPVPGGFDVRPR